MNSKSQDTVAWTIGHSTLNLDAFVRILGSHGIRQLADIRRYPASRRYPHFNRETLEAVLSSRGIEYRWFEDLGGRRAGVREEESPNTGITDAGFRQYADYMLTPEFGAAFQELLAWIAKAPTAFMCAEVLWWRCHRRMVSDQLVAHGHTVLHIRDEEAAEPHELWDIAVQTPEGLVYPPTQVELDLKT